MIFVYSPESVNSESEFSIVWIPQTQSSYVRL